MSIEKIFACQQKENIHSDQKRMLKLKLFGYVIAGLQDAPDIYIFFLSY